MLYLRLSESLRGKSRYLWYFLLTLILTAGLKESGITKLWDLSVLDRLLIMRPAEKIDDRITIVKIEENDLKKEPGGSLSDQKLAKAIEIISKSNPSIIGVDIYRPGKIDPQLKNVFDQHQNIIGIDKILDPNPVLAPWGVSSNQVGFSDYEPDFDGLVRRATLSISTQKGQDKPEIRYSLAFKIAERYLQKNNTKIQFKPEQLELGKNLVYPLKSTDSQLLQYHISQESDQKSKQSFFDILINYRNIHPTFNEVKFVDLMKSTNGLSQKSLDFQNKIVIIGYTASSKSDFVNTVTVPDSAKKINGNIYGVEYHGHIVSQLISTALDNRNSIQPLPSWIDYLWIFTCLSIIHLLIILFSNKTIFVQFSIFLIALIIGISLNICIFLLNGWWLSIGATFLTISIIDFLILLSIYQREQYLISIAEKRRQVIDEAFNAIHNGPSQILSCLLQNVRSERISLPEIGQQLKDINQNILEIGESLKRDSNPIGEEQEMLVLGNGNRIKLYQPLDQLFYCISERILNNSKYYYLKIKIIDFQKLPNENKLSIDNKRQLCQFLEEAIGNVGKHAKSATRLELIGEVDGEIYRLKIENNGQEIISSREGEGTKQAKRLAKRLKGKFTRTQKTPQGVICSIEWKF